MKESTIRAKILQYLNSLPESCFEVSPPGSRTGKPDLTGCLEGCYVAIEIKKPGNRPTRIQYYAMDKLRAAGALVFWTTDLEGVKYWLREHEVIGTEED